MVLVQLFITKKKNVLFIAVLTFQYIEIGLFLTSFELFFFFFNLTFKTPRNIRKLALWQGLVFTSNTKHCITIIVYLIKSYRCFFHLAEKYTMGMMTVD